MSLFALHGLVIECDAELTGVALAQGSADITISSSQMTDQWRWDGQERDHWIHVSDDKTRVRIDVPDVAVFLVTRGRQIEYARAGDATSGAFQSFLLGRVLAAALYQRGLFPLHGSAVEIDGQVVILLGERGAGKSTLAAALMRAGHRLIADDVSVISPALTVASGVGRSKLWADSLDHFGVALDGLTPVDLQEGKFFWDGAEQGAQNGPVACLIELHEGVLGAQKLNHVEGFDLCRRHSFEFDFVRAFGLEQVFMDWAGSLVPKVPAHRLSYPRDFDVLDRVCKRITVLAKDNAR